MRSATMRFVTSSGTKSPLSMYFLASTPSGVIDFTLWRKMSPVEIGTIPILSAIRVAWVPLPEPGGPMSSMRVIVCSSLSIRTALRDRVGAQRSRPS